VPSEWSSFRPATNSERLDTHENVWGKQEDVGMSEQTGVHPVVRALRTVVITVRLCERSWERNSLHSNNLPVFINYTKVTKIIPFTVLLIEEMLMTVVDERPANKTSTKIREQNIQFILFFFLS
jgi:hypothetical protein